MPVHRDSSRRALVADIVGPICESGDCFAKDRQLQEVGEGELVAFMSAGAYGYVMASRYNTRGMPAEVLVNGSAFELVNARENFEQMTAGEKIPGVFEMVKVRLCRCGFRFRDNQTQASDIKVKEPRPRSEPPRSWVSLSSGGVRVGRALRARHGSVSEQTQEMR